MTKISLVQQINKIENLSTQELDKLLITLLEKKGFRHIIKAENYIKAFQSGLIGDSIAIFITFPYKMGGVVESTFTDIAKTILDISNENAANSIFIYSQMVITHGFKDSLNKKLNSLSPQYLGRDELVSLISKEYPEFWKHEDIMLIKYEQKLLTYLSQDNDLRYLKFPKENYNKLLDIFIEPQLVRFYEDPRTKTAIQKKYSMSELIDHSESLLIDGPAGYGKSTLLKRIARQLIDQNSPQGRKNIPIYISSLDIFENDYNIGNTIRKKLSDFTESPLSELAEDYNIHILIDSIDEFEDKIQNILQELSKLQKNHGVKYYIATRNSESIAQRSQTNLSKFSIRRFNLAQIKLFLNAFFSGDEGKTSTLLDAIKDNQMIERLPMTPLTLSLISILYEEKEMEIPATISDIYDNFNTLIIGKAIVSSKVEFIDISFKERILSIYAYELLQKPAHIPLKKEEFIDFFHNYYQGKSLPIRKGSLEDVLSYLIQNTGILFLKDGERVQFTHESYMEYYSALEIFKHRRGEEEKLVNNFLDPHWQNAAIFYAGMSKDLPEFLNKIKIKISQSRNVSDYMSAILGAGFILQALYQTNNQLRKEVILEALSLSLKNLSVFKMMAADSIQLFKNYNLPILTFINFIYFFESFNSITLAEPLQLAFDEQYLNYSISNDSGIGYNLLELAFTLDSKRIQRQDALERLILSTPDILKEPVLNILASISMDLLGKERYKEYLSDLKKTRGSLSLVQRDLIKLPMEKLRFTAVDNINPLTKVYLFVEGQTDAVILEYAYLILTNGSMPYWNITSAGPASAINSCEEVAKTLIQSYSHWKIDNDCIYIGLFDHDNAGLGCYRGKLESKFFTEIEKDVIKKHVEANIYGLCLPIPGEKEEYIQEKQEFNYFEIEHYFSHDFLESNNMLKESGIPGIFEIKNGTGVKTAFSRRIKKISDPRVFEHFLLLFRKIDVLTGVEVEYVL